VIYLIDTNAISELCRTRPNKGVLAWAEDVTQFAVSVISVEEIFFGLVWHPNGRVLKWMEAFFQRHEVLPIFQNIARGGTLRGQLTARDIIREQADMLIAATAQATSAHSRHPQHAGFRELRYQPFKSFQRQQSLITFHHNQFASPRKTSPFQLPAHLRRILIGVKAHQQVQRLTR
jgi:predicted nucleic acid-binding protein